MTDATDTPDPTKLTDFEARKQYKCPACYAPFKKPSPNRPPQKRQCKCGHKFFTLPEM